MRVVDLAKDLIRLSGFEPDSDIAIVFTGVRPGEKLYEELSISGENITHTSHPKIFIGRHTIHAWRNFTTKLEALEKDASIGIERDVLIEKLIELVPEFTPESREERQPKPQTAAVISFPS